LHIDVEFGIWQPGPSDQFQECGLTGRPRTGTNLGKHGSNQQSAPTRSLSQLLLELRHGGQPTLYGVGHERAYVVASPKEAANIDNRPRDAGAGDSAPEEPGRSPPGLMYGHEPHVGHAER
jgi:hypothetical protein